MQVIQLYPHNYAPITPFIMDFKADQWSEFMQGTYAARTANYQIVWQDLKTFGYFGQQCYALIMLEDGDKFYKYIPGNNTYFIEDYMGNLYYGFFDQTVYLNNSANNTMILNYNGQLEYAPADFVTLMSRRGVNHFIKGSF